MSKPVRVALISLSAFVLSYIFIGGVLAQTTQNNDKTYRDLGVYSQVLNRIQRAYVTKPNLGRATTGAIRGLLLSLDPYSTYFSPAEYQQYEAHPQLGPGRVGIYASERGGFATVVEVLPGSPAAKAGIETGDLIDSIGDHPVREDSVIQIDRALAGPVGSTVAVGIVHQAHGEPRILSLTRVQLQYPQASLKMLPDRTAYIKVVTFNRGMAGQVRSKLRQAEAQAAAKIVLDLRNCAGGHISEAEKTANFFIAHGLITYLAGQQFPRKDFSADSALAITKLPLVVLINQSTAGPAEILAGAIQSDHRGQVVGTRSFGVGVYQQLIPVGDGSALLLSVAKYYTPSGHVIQGQGIQPDVVEQENAGMAALTGTSLPKPMPGVPHDPQLEKAIEILQQATPRKAA